MVRICDLFCLEHSNLFILSITLALEQFNLSLELIDLMISQRQRLAEVCNPDIIALRLVLHLINLSIELVLHGFLVVLQRDPHLDCALLHVLELLLQAQHLLREDACARVEHVGGLLALPLVVEERPERFAKLVKVNAAAVTVDMKRVR